MNLDGIMQMPNEKHRLAQPQPVAVHETISLSVFPRYMVTEMLFQCKFRDVGTLRVREGRVPGDRHGSAQESGDAPWDNGPEP